MAKDFLEEVKKEQEILDIGMKESLRAKAERTERFPTAEERWPRGGETIQMSKKVFCIGNGESRQGFDLELLRQHGKIYGCNAIYRDFMPDVLTAVDHGIMHEIYHAGIAQKIPCYFRDWTKVPAMTYENMLLAGMEKKDVDPYLKEVLVTNERGDSTEYVMHGSNIRGLVTIIREQPQKYKKDREHLEKKNINHSTIKVSWIKEPDYSHTLMDICTETDHKGVKRDLGWACGASAGYIAIKNEQPNKVYLIGHDLNSTHDKINNIYKSTKHYTAKDNGPTPSINWIKQWKTLFDWFPNTIFIKVNRYNDSRDQVNGPIKEWEGTKNLVYADYSTLDNLA